MSVPLHFKQALIRNIPLTQQEVLLQTIHNAKCVSLKSLWNILPREEFNSEKIASRNALKENYLQPLIDNGSLKRDAPNEATNLYKKGGFAVDIFKAYKYKLPYTMMGLNPLPDLYRLDYIFHLILYRDPLVAYEVFPERQDRLDKFCEESIYYAETMLQNDPQGLFSGDLKNFLNKHSVVSNSDRDFEMALARRHAMAKEHQRKLAKLPIMQRISQENEIIYADKFSIKV